MYISYFSCERVKENVVLSDATSLRVYSLSWTTLEKAKTFLQIVNDILRSLRGSWLFLTLLEE